MKKYIALFLVVFLFLFSALPIFATPFNGSDQDYFIFEPSDIKFNLALRDENGKVSTWLLGTENETHRLPSLVGSTAAPIKDVGTLLSITADYLVPGNRYYYEFVLTFDENAFLPPADNQHAGTFVSDGTTLERFYFGEAVEVSLFSTDRNLASEYPNLTHGFSDNAYSSSSILVSGSFVAEADHGNLFLYFPLVYDSYAVSGYVSYSYFSMYSERISFLDYLGLNIRNLISGVDSNLTSGFSSLTSGLSSIYSVLSSGFSQLHSDLSQLISAVGNGFNMSAEDEQEFEDMENDAESFNNSAADKQAQQNSAAQQQQQVNKDKQNQVNDLKEQQDQFNRIESDFKGSYGGSTDFQDINESINQQISGEYGGALIWWGEVFGEFFSFAPLKTMLNVAVFFGLLMLLFGVGTRAGLRVSARERRSVRHSD